MNQDLYKQLNRLIPGIDSLRPGERRVSRSPGLMNLHLEVLEPVQGRMLLTLAHYYESQGDTVPDPRMTIWVDPSNRTAGATNYETAYGSSNIEGNNHSFLKEWLDHLLEQDHSLTESNN